LAGGRIIPLAWEIKTFETQRGRAATKNTHHGGTETRRRLKAKVKNQNLNTEDTEKLGGRGGLKNTESKLKGKSFFAAWYESVC
jgi:hypothetical protein